MTLFITKEETEKLLSVEAAIPVIEEAFRATGENDTENWPRFRTAWSGGLHFSTASLHSKRMTGFKLSTNFGGQPARTFDFLYSLDNNELLAIIQAWSLSRFRTSAATAVAARHLSPETASIVGIYGTGRQAEAHLEAVVKVRPIRQAYVYSPTAVNRNSFSQKMAQQLGIEVIPVEQPHLVAREADIIVTTTSSQVPVLFGDWITRPALVIGVGATRSHRRELDEKLVQMAKLIVVDDKEQAKLECGNLLWPIGDGLLKWDQVCSLGEVLVGRVERPSFSSGIIVFLLHGTAFLDVAIANKAYELARERHIGTEINL